MSILAQPIRNQFADLDCFVEPIPCVLRSHPTNGVEVHGNYRLPAKNFQRTCKNLKFHLWRGPTFKKLQKTWRQGPTLQKHENLEVPPLTGTNLQLQLQWFPFETSVGGEFEAMKLLTESKGHGPSKTHFFVISKPPTKPLSLKPVQNHETSLKCP